MNTQAMLSSALLSALALGLAAPAQAAEGAKEKCYGIAKAGQNDCANLGGTHSCAGQAKGDNQPREWKYVPQGTCKQISGGMSADEAKLALKK